eukprot:13907399-Ditylum_brightwellii.AAC.2
MAVLLGFPRPHSLRTAHAWSRASWAQEGPGDMFCLYGADSEGLRDLVGNMGEQKVSEGVTTKLKVVQKTFSNNVFFTSQVLAVAHNLFLKFLMRNEVGDHQVLWVGHLIEARFVKPAHHR